MPAPVDMILFRAGVLPQRPGRRNGNIVTRDCPVPPSDHVRVIVKQILAVAFIVLAGSTQADEFNWQYDSDRDSRMTRTTSEKTCERARVPRTDYIILPQPTWPEDKKGDDQRGWQFTNPQLATGRPDAFVGDREAVRIEEAQRDEALLENTNAPAGLDHLPDAFRGLDYRVELGLLYRF